MVTRVRDATKSGLQDAGQVRLETIRRLLEKAGVDIRGLEKLSHRLCVL